jgi:hypothetical protein
MSPAQRPTGLRHLLGGGGRLAPIVHGAIAGMTGADCMTALRLAARRAGLIDRMPPQAMREWAWWRAGVRSGDTTPARHLADHVLHLGVSVVGGTLWGVLAARRGGTLPGATLFGLGVWAVAFGAIAPLAGITRPPWRAGPAENAVNLLAHALYGAVLGLVTHELGRQPRPAATSDRERYAVRVG